jgi:hypothetical protein
MAPSIQTMARRDDVASAFPRPERAADCADRFAPCGGGTGGGDPFQGFQFRECHSGRVEVGRTGPQEHKVIAGRRAAA